MLQINFIKEDFKGSYGTPDDCPIFLALVRLGYNVVAVSSVTAWIKFGDKEYPVKLNYSDYDSVMLAAENIGRSPVFFEIEDKILNYK